MDLSSLLLPALLVGLLIFMFVNGRRRTQKLKAEQEEKARQTIPGAEVMLQNGMYGTIVEFDADNLDRPAIVELAPGVEVKVHTQAILRVVTPSDDEELAEDDDEDEGDDLEQLEPADDEDVYDDEDDATDGDDTDGDNLESASHDGDADQASPGTNTKA